MQLIRLTLILFASANCFAQSDSDSSKIKLEDIEINILSSYYQQDGIHSPVTGGEGTEQLSNIAPSIYVYVPIDTLRSINIGAGVDFYSSASSDNIDNPYLSPNHVSGASADDIRHHYSFSYSKANNQKLTKNTYKIAASSEYDVTSISGGYTFEKENKKKQRELSVGINYFFDDWKRIYPVELRNGTTEYLNTDKRQTLSLNFSQAFIINKKMNLSWTLEALGQYGMLSTPFHRVYFVNEELPKIEILPSLRLKIPLALRLNAHMNDRLILRTFNRIYWDSWDVKGYTFELETPIKVTDWFRLYPFYRFHVQTASTYFAASREHLSSQSFYTSDYDLSGFSSNKYGLGFKISPLFGIGRFKWLKESTMMFKSIGVRYAYYQRSDGLNAWALTAGLEFKIHR
jgi:hypothetical protein